MKEDLRRIIGAARAARATVILVAVPEPSLLGVIARKPSDSPIYQELGEEENVPVIRDVFSDILGRAELRADAILPMHRGIRWLKDSSSS